jgi:hypothetical protein
MANSPTDEFDWDAHYRDTRVLSPAARGAWWDCLFHMRLSVTRGRISMPVASYARVFGTTVEQAGVLLDEISGLSVGDAVTEHNGNITITNRRMHRAYLEREANKNRQKRHRERIARGETSEGNGNVTEEPENALYVLEEENNNKQEKKKKRKSVESTRIAESFPLTDEMQEWARANLPELDLISAHLDFVEYWTNNTTAKAYKVNWRLTWEKGMKLALKWQKENNGNQNGNKNGKGSKPDQPGDKGTNGKSLADIGVIS